MAGKTREAIQKALFEAFFVVLAVVLALAANQWRENRADQNQARAALASILEEVRSNRKAVLRARGYHASRLQRIQELRADGAAPQPSDFQRGFIAPAQVFQTAWDAAGDTGALAHMDYSTVLELSRLYARQQRYERQELAIGAIIYEELFRTGVPGVLANYANLAAIINTFLYRERQLIDFYDRTLAALGEPPEDAGGREATAEPPPGGAAEQ